MNCGCNETIPSRRNSTSSYNGIIATNDKWGVLSEYAGSSTIHGIRYLTEPKRPLAERVWWIIAFIISLYCCGTLIMSIWIKWDENPVIVSFADKSTQVWKIPFPAVTICPQTKTRTQFLNFTEKYHAMGIGLNETLWNLTDHDDERMKAIYQVCEEDIAVTNEFNQTFAKREMIDTLREIAPKHKEIFFFCLWTNEFKENLCNELFTEILTDIGVCYTFNMLNEKELYRESEIQKEYNYYNHTEKSTNWTLEDGYAQHAPYHAYPKRVLSSNRKDSLELYLSAYEYDMDYICYGPTQGFKILFHNPSDVPQFNKNYNYILLDQEVTFKLTPKMTTTTKGLKNYSPIKRQCYYTSDRYLRFFKVYTKRNCELECLSNHTLSKCGCVKFSMPSASDTKICGTQSIECYFEAEYELSTVRQKQILLKNDLNYTDVGDDLNITDCACLPECTSIEYEAESTNFHLDWESLIEAFKFDMSSYPGIKVAHATIYFKETQFVASKRSELYGLTDFVANSGGLLGLFMGVSLLSIVEIIYFCTIRIISNLMMKKNHISTSADEILLKEVVISTKFGANRNLND